MIYWKSSAKNLISNSFAEKELTNCESQLNSSVQCRLEPGSNINQLVTEWQIKNVEIAAQTLNFQSLWMWGFSAEFFPPQNVETAVINNRLTGRPLQFRELYKLELRNGMSVWNEWPVSGRQFARPFLVDNFKMEIYLLLVMHWMGSDDRCVV